MAPPGRPWQVRAASLNELIYKQGQAGVTKASVTLVFDNTDPAMSPHGYDQYPQLTVTRQVCCRPRHQRRAGRTGPHHSLRCVCLLGGDWRAQQVHDQRHGRSAEPRAEPLPFSPAEREQPPLFGACALEAHVGHLHSPDLCAHGPPLLVQIMQGRITKVLNMKPQEILGLIEEAAGTRMFELKKQQAIKTIEKKETKLTEIDRVRALARAFHARDGTRPRL